MDSFTETIEHYSKLKSINEAIMFLKVGKFILDIFSHYDWNIDNIFFKSTNIIAGNLFKALGKQTSKGMVAVSLNFSIWNNC